ncbi:uroplakin-1a-like [Cebus imitator]|uniref:uroplakin-1a-like n=1 Tax=Cebus imitator TaxID=2715852 RepID=UPI000809EAD2|nr:uroplakin-1a-like [Cebus imitator]
MLIVFIFECASCITSYTHRDYMVSNPSLITKQMLTFYSADTEQGQELTRLWDRVMIEVGAVDRCWEGLGLPLFPLVEE